jgi:hypothetical protein
MQEFTFCARRQEKTSCVVKRQKHLKRKIKHIMSGIDFLLENERKNVYKGHVAKRNQLIHLNNNDGHIGSGRR